MADPILCTACDAELNGDGVNQWCEHCDVDHEPDADCGLQPDGQCMLAGTEYCDWDCGALNEQRIADMKARS